MSSLDAPIFFFYLFYGFHWKRVNESLLQQFLSPQTSTSIKDEINSSRYDLHALHVQLDTSGQDLCLELHWNLQLSRHLCQSDKDMIQKDTTRHCVLLHGYIEWSIYLIICRQVQCYCLWGPYQVLFSYSNSLFYQYCNTFATWMMNTEIWFPSMNIVKMANIIDTYMCLLKKCNRCLEFIQPL